MCVWGGGWVGFSICSGVPVILMSVFKVSSSPRAENSIRAKKPSLRHIHARADLLTKFLCPRALPTWETGEILIFVTQLAMRELLFGKKEYSQLIN